MSAVTDEVVVADEPISTVQPVHDDLNTLEISGKLATDEEVVDSAANCVKEVAAGSEDVPGVDENNDGKSVTAASDDTLAAETSVEALNVSKLVNNEDPEAPLMDTSDSDNENSIIIQDSEPPTNEEIKSFLVEAYEQSTTSTMVSKEEPVALAESTQDDANEVADAAISEITKDEIPVTDDTETQTPSVDVNATIVQSLEASVESGEPPISSSIGPESAVSDAVKPSINGVGSTTSAEPSLSQETPTRDPSIEMSRSAEVLEEAITPAVGAQGIPSAAAAVVEDTSESIEAAASQVEEDVSPVEERPTVTEPMASIAPAADITTEDQPIAVEAEPVELPSSSGEPETVALEDAPVDSTLGEAVVEKTVAITEPEPEPTLPPALEEAESEPSEETAATLEPTTAAAESDPTEETAPVTEALLAVAEPAGTPVAEEEKADEEPEAPTVVAAEEEPIAANDSIAAEPAQIAVSDPTPVPTTEIDISAVVESESAAVAPDTPTAIEPEDENMVVETVPIDVEPPSSAASFIEDPEIGFTVAAEESQTPQTEETAPLVLNESADEEFEPQEAVAFEESHVTVEEAVLVEEVVPVDLATPTTGPASIEDAAPVEESLIEGTDAAPAEEVAPVEDVVPVENVAPVEAVEESAPVEEITVTSIDSAPIESTPAVEEAVVEESESIVENLTAPADELEVPVPQETLEAAVVEEELSAPSPVEEDTPVVEEPSAPAPVEEDTPVVEEPSAPVPVEKYIPVAEEPSVSLPVEEVITVVEEPSAPAPVEEDTPVVEEPSAPALVEEDISVAEEPSAPVPVEEVITVIEEPSAPVPVEEDIPAAAEEPSVPVPVEEVIAVTEEPAPTPVEEDTPIVEEPPIPAPVEEDISVAEEPSVPVPVERVIAVVEESSAPAQVQEDIPIVEEHSAPAPVEEDTTVVEDDPCAPALVEEDTSIVEEPSAPAPVEEDIPVAEEPSSPVKEVIAVIEEPSAPVPVEEDIPVVEEPSAPAPVEEDIPVVDEPSAPAPVEEDILVVEEPSAPAPVEKYTPIVEDSLMPAPVEEHTPLSEESAIPAPVEEGYPVVEEPSAPTPAEEYIPVVEEPSAPAPVDEDAPIVEEPSPPAPVEDDVRVAEDYVPVKVEEDSLVVEEPEPVTVEDAPAPVEEHKPVTEVPSAADESAFEEPPESGQEPAFALLEPERPVEEVAEQELAASTVLSIATDIERPKSPWTPSYSVTTLGSNFSVEESASTYEDENDTVPTHVRTPEIVIDEAAAIVPEVTSNVEVDRQGDDDLAVQSAEEQVTLGEVEEAKSPWTPSYSVTVQGGVAQNNEGLDDLEQLPPSAAQSVQAVEEQPVSFTQEALVADEVSSSTEVIADAHVMLSETLNNTVEHAVHVEAEHAPLEQVLTSGETEPSVGIPPEPAIAEEEFEEEIEQGSFIVEDESQLGITEPVEERSRSPWTPSYSVTVLEPASALQNQVLANEEEFVEQGSFIIETQLTAVAEDIAKAKPELLTPVDDPVDERPKSPWTPSYSVTMQGPTEEMEELDELEQLPGPVASAPAPAVDEEPIPPVFITETRASVDEHVVAEEAPAAQVFPILEVPQKISQKPNLSAVDELNATSITDVSESTTLRIDIPSTNEDGRKRLESTTSSRFFPGGWFSSSPKVPEEGRASLDVAAGEFVHQTSVENTPTTAIPSAVEEDREKKSRWCTIM